MLVVIHLHFNACPCRCVIFCTTSYSGLSGTIKDILLALNVIYINLKEVLTAVKANCLPSAPNLPPCLPNKKPCIHCRYGIKKDLSYLLTDRRLASKKLSPHAYAGLLLYHNLLTLNCCKYHQITFLCILIVNNEGEV